MDETEVGSGLGGGLGGWGVDKKSRNMFTRAVKVKVPDLESNFDNSTRIKK